MLFRSESGSRKQTEPFFSQCSEGSIHSKVDSKQTSGHKCNSLEGILYVFQFSLGVLDALFFSISTSFLKERNISSLRKLWATSFLKTHFSLHEQKPVPELWSPPSLLPPDIQGLTGCSTRSQDCGSLESRLTEKITSSHPRLKCGPGVFRVFQ